MLDQGDLDHQKPGVQEIGSESFQRRFLMEQDLPGGGVPEQHTQEAQKMGLPRSEMALEKGAPAGGSAQGGQDHLQALPYLGGNHEGMKDHLPQTGIVQVLQLNDGFDFGDLNQIADPDHVPASSDRSACFCIFLSSPQRNLCWGY